MQRSIWLPIVHLSHRIKSLDIVASFWNLLGKAANGITNQLQDYAGQIWAMPISDHLLHIQRGVTFSSFYVTEMLFD